jgi:hypothetical protein
MLESAHKSLQRTLNALLSQQRKTEKEIKAVQSALSHLSGSAESKLSKRRRRSPMTTAERKSVSRRMKAYWAKRRKE